MSRPTNTGRSTMFSTSTSTSPSTSAPTSRSLSPRTSTNTSTTSRGTETSCSSLLDRYPTQVQQAPKPKYTNQPFSAWKAYLGEEPDQTWIDYKKEMIGEKEPKAMSNTPVGSSSGYDIAGTKEVQNRPRTGTKLVKSSSDPVGMGLKTAGVTERAKARTKDVRRRMGMGVDVVKKL